MVRKRGKLFLNIGEGVVATPPPSTLTLSNFRAKTVGPINIGQLFKIFKILIVPSFWLTFDDVTVTLPLAGLS